MSAPNLHISLLRPPIIQILRAAGFHSARSAVIDTLTDIASRYLLLLATSAVDHATNSHPDNPSPNMDDLVLALQDAGAIRPQMSGMEEEGRGEEDMRGLETFLAWFSGPSNREIRRVAGFLPSEGDVGDADSLEREDYLTGLYFAISLIVSLMVALKKKHSKTGEESRYQGTVLGKTAEEHPIVIEGGVQSIKDWGMQIKTKEVIPESVSPHMSSTFSHPSEPDDMEI